jgi:threonine dehydratase
VTVEPEGWDDMRRSLKLGEIVPVPADAPPTLCDALQTPKVSPITFGILRGRGVSGLAVSEVEVVAAIRWAWNEHQLVVEPGGAASIAALLAAKAEIVPETVVLVSGGNIDPALHARLVG